MLQAAEQHYQQQARLGAIASRQALREWDQLPLGALDTWDPRRLTSLVTALQLTAAMEADPYVTAALEEQGIDPAAGGRVIPDRLAGVAGDGRSLLTLLDEPRIEAKTAIGQGAPAQAAWESARSTLQLMAVTAVQDAGRVAAGVGTVARPHAGGYVRMLNPPSCSRCAILAGKFYRWNTGFQRHPRCDCRHVPTQENVSGDLTTDPDAYFHSLPAAEQERIFTKAGAQAIRDGADIGQVVNARRGMSTAQVFGRHLQVTSEGTTARGLASRAMTRERRHSARAPRLMPESIYEIAGRDRDQAVRLLRLNGYLT